jgi:tetratricopeptide (TPR) repeat protein
VAADLAIAANPGDGALYLKRAGLRTEHGDWELARADVVAAAKAGAPADYCAYARARIAVAERKWRDAEEEIAKFQNAYATDAEAWRLRATIHENLQQTELQIDARKAVLSHANPALPDDFLALARCLVSIGKMSEGQRILELGLQQLGMVPAILDALIDIDVKAKAWDGALRRVDAAAAHFSNPSRWLVRKGDIAQEAGRADLAREARKSALAVLEALPEARRNVPANAALVKELRSKLAESPEQK